MKKIIITAAIALFSLVAKAQKNTLLDQSFWRNQPDIATVKAEVEKGNNPSQANQMNMDPVVLAILNQAPSETIKYLVGLEGNSVTKVGHEGRTYLHWVAMRGDADLIDFLVAKGADIKLKEEHGLSPLSLVASSGQLKPTLVDYFISKGVDIKKEVTADGANILLLAISNDKDLSLTTYLQSKGLDINSVDNNGNNAFCYVAKSGNIAPLKLLVEKGIKPSENAFFMAAQGNRRGPAAPLEFYEYLESLNLKPTGTTKEGENVLHFIVRKPNQKAINEHFVAKGVNVNQADNDGNTPFINAASSNRDVATIELLASKAQNINQANAKGETALMLAVKGNSPEIVQLLISKGADVNAINKAGENLSAYLIQSYSGGGEGRMGMGGGKPEDFDNKIKALQEKGFNVATPQKNGNTLYHLAIMKNDLGLLKRLEPLKLDINAKNQEGITILHKAAMLAKDDTILKYLLETGAKKEIVTNFGETAFDLASENETLTKRKVSINFLK